MFSENLKKIRKEKGLSQEALSEKLNIVRQTISKWEKGLSVPDGDMLIKISQVLEIPVETLLGTDSTLENRDAVNQAIQLQIINSLLENSNRRGAKMPGMMLAGVIISIIGTFFCVLLMILATVNGVTMVGEPGILGLIKGYGAMAFFVISIVTIVLGIIIFGIGIFLKYKEEK